MKLEKETVVMRRLQMLEAEGVTFICNTEIGKDITPEQLRQDYDAVILCTSSTRPRDLPIEGRDLKGVYFGNGVLDG